MSKKVNDILIFFPLIFICLVSSLYGSTVIEKSLHKSGYALQIAAFSQESQAKRLTHRLLEKGYNAYWVVSHSARLGKVLYLVRTGYFKKGNMDKARKQLAEFNKKEGRKAIVANVDPSKTAKTFLVDKGQQKSDHIAIKESKSTGESVESSMKAEVLPKEAKIETKLKTTKSKKKQPKPDKTIIIEKALPKSGTAFQVAGFFQESKAKRLTIRLLEKGYDAYWVVSHSARLDKVLYLVRTGYFKKGNMDKARKQLAEFNKKEGRKAIVVNVDPSKTAKTFLIEPKLKIEPKSEIEPKTEPKPQIEPKPKIEPKIEPKSKIEPKIEPKPEIKPKPKNAFTDFYYDFIDNKLEIGTRIRYTILLDDKREKYGDNRYLGTIYGLEVEQNYIPIHFFIDYLFNEYVGLELSYYEIEAETVAWSTGFTEDKSDGNVSMKGPILSLIGRLPTKYSFTPFLGFGLGYFFGDFDETDHWHYGYIHPSVYNAAGRPTSSPFRHYMDVDDTFGYTFMSGVIYDINENIKIDLLAQYINIDADATFTGIWYGNKSVYVKGTYPLENISFSIGMRYHF